MTSPHIVQIKNISHYYGARIALDKVTLNIPSRCMAGLIGPDGVGKSTLLGIISGVRKIQDGAVNVLNGNMYDRAHREVSYARIAYMPQGLGKNLYPTLSVFENLDFFGRLFGQKKEERILRITELLTSTGLDPFINRPAGKLSGGMKQKLSLCCALIHDPDLLILDEPTTGVDPLSRRQFWDLISNIRTHRSHMSVIVATAYMDEAERFDWLAAMDDGKIITQGSPSEIKNQVGTNTLEQAFIALLPERKRASHKEVIIRSLTTSHDKIPAIEAEGLTCRFGNFTAVDHVSFKIGKGEIFGFLGSNGCGKSTTMKMLTGLLPPTEGTAKLFGSIMDTKSGAMRSRVGYMSQAFSLYNELTVQQNLELHAYLFHIPREIILEQVQEMLLQYELVESADMLPDSLPLGIKQRLQLAVAVIHKPEMLILDEPTSGVDPIARDAFWRTLINLSRDDGVTIFISTHFMNEAERCDRISLMHAGKVLAMGKAQELVKARGSKSLEDTFISYLIEVAGGKSTGQLLDVSKITTSTESSIDNVKSHWFDIQLIWAYAQRETLELFRDHIRLIFAFLGPIILMITFSFGISFDVENISFAYFDQDKTPESRALLENFLGSRYFSEQTEILSIEELEQRLKSGTLQLAIEIPPNYGLNLLSNKQPEVSILIDGSMPFLAETIKGYVTAISMQYATKLLQHKYRENINYNLVNIETRFLYNQSFKSVNAMIPSIIMLMLVLIPSIMSAIAIVREEETGSIANFRSTPITKFEFLIGKQSPYILIALLNFITLIFFAKFIFHVSVKGSIITLILGTFFYVIATTGLGQFISTFTKTQVAAVFATAIISIIPAVNFSGLIVPVSSLSGGARIFGLAFPSAWYQKISIGTFTKALGFEDLWVNLLMLFIFDIIFIVAAQIMLCKQEK